MDPLVPADVDLRGMPFMPLDVNRLRDSQLAIHASGDEFRAAVLLWCASWNQVPAASLPNDEKSLAAFAGYARDLKGWKKVREGALRGFELCDDGRLYHAVVAEKALEAWEERVEYREEKSNKDERKKRERAWRQVAFSALRAIGITPDWNEKTSVLRELVKDHGLNIHLPTKPDVTQPVTPVTPPVTVTGACHVTAKTETGTETETGIQDQEHPLTPAGGNSADAEPRERSRRSPRPSVPYEEIVEAFRQQLPSLAKPRNIGPKRELIIRKAWGLLPENHRVVGAFKAIFAECAQDPFLNGTGPYRGEHETFRPTFDFLLREDQFVKVYERAMHRREQQRQQGAGSSGRPAADPQQVSA